MGERLRERSPEIAGCDTFIIAVDRSFRSKKRGPSLTLVLLPVFFVTQV
jgi:hypothetical protein